MKWFIIVLTIGMIAFLYYSNHAYTLSEYNVNGEIPNNFSGFKILHLSDIHDHQFSKSFYKKVDNLSPDIVVITGDIIDSRRYDLEKCINNLKSLDYPIYYVSGNHETRSGHIEEIEEALHKLGIYVLKNETKAIVIDNEEIYIHGIEEHTKPKFLIKGYTILLSHRSESVNYYSLTGVDIVLSGHAHGGQINLFGQGLYAPNQGFFPEYTGGMHQFNTYTHIISRGIGNSLFPQRLFNKPEIILLTLERNNDE